jgi:hypothetical protein
MNHNATHNASHVVTEVPEGHLATSPPQEWLKKFCDARYAGTQQRISLEGLRQAYDIKGGKPEGTQAMISNMIGALEKRDDVSSSNYEDGPENKEGEAQLVFFENYVPASPPHSASVGDSLPLPLSVSSDDDDDTKEPHAKKQKMGHQAAPPPLKTGWIERMRYISVGHGLTFARRNQTTVNLGIDSPILTMEIPTVSPGAPRRMYIPLGLDRDADTILDAMRMIPVSSLLEGELQEEVRSRLDAGTVFGDDGQFLTFNNHTFQEDDAVELQYALKNVVSEAADWASTHFLNKYKLKYRPLFFNNGSGGDSETGEGKKAYHDHLTEKDREVVLTYYSHTQLRGDICAAVTQLGFLLLENCQSTCVARNKHQSLSSHNEEVWREGILKFELHVVKGGGWGKGCEACRPPSGAGAPDGTHYIPTPDHCSASEVAKDSIRHHSKLGDRYGSVLGLNECPTGDVDNPLLTSGMFNDNINRSRDCQASRSRTQHMVHCLCYTTKDIWQHSLQHGLTIEDLRENSDILPYRSNVLMLIKGHGMTKELLNLTMKNLLYQDVLFGLNVEINNVFNRIYFEYISLPSSSFGTYKPTPSQSLIEDIFNTKTTMMSMDPDTARSYDWVVAAGGEDAVGEDETKEETEDEHVASCKKQDLLLSSQVVTRVKGLVCDKNGAALMQFQSTTKPRILRLIKTHMLRCNEKHWDDVTRKSLKTVLTRCTGCAQPVALDAATPTIRQVDHLSECPAPVLIWPVEDTTTVPRVIPGPKARGGVIAYPGFDQEAYISKHFGATNDRGEIPEAPEARGSTNEEGEEEEEEMEEEEEEEE